MAYRLNRSKITPILGERIQRDLSLVNEKSNTRINFFILNATFVFVPLYYARSLLTSPNSHYMDTIDKLDLTMNNRSSQEILPFTVNIVPYDYQEQLIQEAKEELSNKGSVMVNAYTSFGKSIVLLYLMQYTKCLTLILLTRDTFLTQIGCIMEIRSTAKVWIPGTRTKVSLSAVSKKPPEGVQVIICMMGRVHYIPPALLDSVGTLVIDEAHLACTPTCVRPILSARPRYTILLTATPNREDNMHSMLNLLSGPTRLIRTMENPVLVIRWATNIHIPIYQSSNGKADWKQHMDYLSNSTARNELIREFIYNLVHSSRRESKLYKLVKKYSNEPRHKILGMTWRAESHRTAIMEKFSNYKEISVDYLDSDKKQYEDCDFLIGTFGKVGVAFDQALFCENFDGVRIDIAIMMASTKSFNVLIQARGRACRSDTPIFVYMVDDNPISENHWRICRKMLLEEPGTRIVYYKGE